MYTINDEKILVFTDIHLGIRSDSIVRLDIAEELIDQIVNTLKKDKIKTVIFCGDWHHTRPSLSVETMCRSIRMIKKIAKHAKLYFILGNHDLRDNISTNITSLKFLTDIKNVFLIDKATECMIGDKKVLFCPWLSDLSEYEAETYDALFGHFDISHKYIIESYMEDHMSEELSPAEITNVMIKSGYDIETKLIDKSTLDKTKLSKKANSKKHIGKFVDLCKKNGFIYSGHIHNRRTFKIKSRNFTFMGSPFQLTWGDWNKHSNTSNRGYYILDKTLKAKFIENITSPIHIKYFISELPLDDKAFEDIFDEDIIKGNFVRLILNKQFDYAKLNKIITFINNYNPKESCIVDYDFSIDFDDVGEKVSTVSLKTSKLKYIVDYIDTIDDAIFENFFVERDVIKEHVIQYFNTTEERLG